MLLLLDHSNYELLYSICGTLINFTVDRWDGQKGERRGFGGPEAYSCLATRCIPSLHDNCPYRSVRKAALVEMGGVPRLIEVLERVATSPQASDIEVRAKTWVQRKSSGLLLALLLPVGSPHRHHPHQVDIMLVVFKALYNVCADDAVLGEPLPSRPAVNEDEIGSIEAIVEHIRGSEDLSLHEDLMSLSSRLVGQLVSITRKLEALNLEPI